MALIRNHEFAVILAMLTFTLAFTFMFMLDPDIHIHTLTPHQCH